ncbi:MAG: hypothetical protein ACON4O_01695 [Lentimonas sp.]
MKSLTPKGLFLGVVLLLIAIASTTLIVQLSKKQNTSKLPAETTKAPE